MPGYTAIRNQYRPTSLVPRAYGWDRPSYNRADIPTKAVGRPSGMSVEEVERSLAYEWLNSGTLVNSNYSNPPFTSGASGRLHPLLRTEDGTPARILRGFIRRANWEAGDPISKARLYFMYNPEAITRQYVSYLNQESLDPFNTVFQSGNLVAPPSFMDFTFDLFFDRQTEATQTGHPGVFVDYQFFDLVVRNVIPRDPDESSNQLPDNGVMMVNPRDITVVFSPQLTVQGRPINAQITFEKFTHRMTPVRMRISLTMRVMYFGPMRNQEEYRMQKAQFTTTEMVPFKEEFKFKITYTDIIALQPNVPGQAGSVGGANFMAAGLAALAGGNMGPEGANIVPVAGIGGGVDKRIAGAVTQMIAAARGAGVTLKGGGYRSTAGQIEARKRNGCPDLTSPSSTCRIPTAPLKNGKSTSNHTSGLAIDFENCGRGSKVFNWLAGNAGRYGLKNFPKESWHWSVDGK